MIKQGITVGQAVEWAAGWQTTIGPLTVSEFRTDSKCGQPCCSYREAKCLDSTGASRWIDTIELVPVNSHSSIAEEEFTYMAAWTAEEGEA